MRNTWRLVAASVLVILPVGKQTMVWMTVRIVDDACAYLINTLIRVRGYLRT
jgi:hypothetical protein